MSQFQSFLEQLRPEVERTLDRLLPDAAAAPERLHEAMRYSVFAGGKRVRPALVVLAGERLGVPRADLLPGAAALEMIHTFSLVHDDLPALDDDDLRRGRPTVHRQYDEALAVLAGDALLNLGLETLAREPDAVAPAIRLAAVVCVAEAVGTDGMIGGQVADLEAERQWPDDAAEVLESIHRRKTGALLTSCLRLGGLYAEVGSEEDQLLRGVGDGIGLMFQIADDILDIEATSESLGKTAGKDVEVEKLTYPRIYGLEQSKRMLLEVRDETLQHAAKLPGDPELLESLIGYLATRDR